MVRPKYSIIKLELLKEISNKIFSKKKEIQLAYLYGSQARQTHSEFSDIDIGIVLNKDFHVPLFYIEEIDNLFEEKLKKPINLDLRLLNNATPRFLYNVLKDAIV
ncbi:MAG: nucleotidyltransferase domain-containing protein [Promethearchaeota archaeon]